MRYVFPVILVAFAFFAGMVLGCGVYEDAAVGIGVGFFGGLLLSIPVARDREWIAAIATVAAVTIGFLVCMAVPDSSSFKEYWRQQTSLHIKLDKYYELGAEH
jgi:hypothetical protein